jgi:hypothetical protein
MITKILFALVVAVACWVGELEEPKEIFTYPRHRVVTRHE